MPKKIKPKWGWSGGGAFPPFPFSDEDYILIAESLGIEKIDPEDQAEMEKVVHDYFSNTGILDNRPRNKNIVAALKILQSEAKAFAKTLNNLDTATHGVLVRAYINQKYLTPINDPSKGCFKKTRPAESIEVILERCSNDSNRINQAARKAIINMSGQEKDPGGPTTKKRALRIMLLSLKEIFESITGEKANYPSKNHSKKQSSGNHIVGKFFNFTKTFIDCSLAKTEEPIPDTTLLAHIQKILNN